MSDVGWSVALCGLEWEEGGWCGGVGFDDWGIGLDVVAFVDGFEIGDRVVVDLRSFDDPFECLVRLFFSRPPKIGIEQQPCEKVALGQGREATTSVQKSSCESEKALHASSTWCSASG